MVVVGRQVGWIVVEQKIVLQSEVSVQMMQIEWFQLFYPFYGVHDDGGGDVCRKMKTCMNQQNRKKKKMQMSYKMMCMSLKKVKKNNVCDDGDVGHDHDGEIVQGKKNYYQMSIDDLACGPDFGYALNDDVAGLLSENNYSKMEQIIIIDRSDP